MQPFKMVERAIQQHLEANVPDAQDRVGGDPGYEPGDDFWIWISLLGGRTDEINGLWTVDVDVLARSYALAMDISLLAEAALLSRRIVTPTMRLDRSFQNEAPSERPWGDDSVYRVGAVYVFSARRTG